MVALPDSVLFKGKVRAELLPLERAKIDYFAMMSNVAKISSKISETVCSGTKPCMKSSWTTSAFGASISKAASCLLFTI